MTKTLLTPDMTAAERVECWHLLKPVEGAVGINAVAAWQQKSRGRGINVSIVDTGVEYTHPSLAANIPADKGGPLDQARDFDHSLDGKGRSIHEGGRIANPFDAHGTACAGIVGAVDCRDTDVVGVAPECSLIPVRINANFEPAALEAALEHAAKVGHVILLARYLPRASVGKAKASLSEREKGLYSLEKTLRRIATKIPVVCAAGNGGNEGLIFPACLPETIAVGACSEKGWRSTYSQYGENLDVVALSNDAAMEVRGFVRLGKDEVERRVRDEQEQAWLRAGQPIQPRPQAERAQAERALEDTAYAKDGNLAEFGERAVATTDLVGDAGYNFNGDYCKADGTFGFGGTSAAAAQVAGVIALMLAANPKLMDEAIKAEIRLEAIRKQLRDAASTHYLRSSGKPKEFGYGLVDAKKAVG